MVMAELMAKVALLNRTQCQILIEMAQGRIQILDAEVASLGSTVHPRGPLVLSIILTNLKDSGRAVPKEFWGLSRSTDRVAHRCFVISDESYATYCQRLDTVWPYQVVSIDIRVRGPVRVIPGVKTVTAYLLKSPLTLVAGMEKLTLHDFKDPLEDLPDSLLELEIKGRFNHPLTLPPNLRRLNMVRAEQFNQPITLPESIRHVVLGGSFDQPLLLPPNIESLEFGTFFCIPDEGRFNRPLSLPDSMKKLILSMSFNQPLALGEHVEELYLGSDFNQPITFPAALKDLFLECTRYDHVLELPQQLRTLSVAHHLDDPNELPTYLQSIQVGDALVPRLVFPPRLHRLEWHVDVHVSLPETLKVVKFGHAFTHSVLLPEGLEEAIFLNPEYNMPIDLPSTLKKLYVGDSYSLPLDYPPGCVRGT